MEIAFIIGRVIFGLYWLENAWHHLFGASSMIGYAQSKGMKSPGTAKLAIVGTGILMSIGGLSILLGIRPYYGLAALVIFLLGVSFKMHAYWKESDPMARMNDRIQFMKNMALLGALLMLFLMPQPWAYSLDW